MPKCFQGCFAVADLVLFGTMHWCELWERLWVVLPVYDHTIMSGVGASSIKNVQMILGECASCAGFRMPANVIVKLGLWFVGYVGVLYIASARC
jgi:hypothetical protein